MMTRPADAHRELARTLSALSGADLVESQETAWSSATFTGARHRFVFALRKRPPARSLSRLTTREFHLPGHVVADVAMTERRYDASGCRMTIEALTVEDR